MGPRMYDFCMGPETAGRARYDLSAPFSRGSYSYATDGHIMVRVPRICEDAEAVWPKIEKLAEGITHASLSPLPVVDSDDPIQCPACKGFGLVRPHMAFGYFCDGCKKCTDGYIPARKPHDDQEVCDECEGRKVTWLKHAAVTMTPQYSIAPRYYRLIAALPNPMIDLAVSYERASEKGVTFAFDGGDGLIMPLRIRLS